MNPTAIANCFSIHYPHFKKFSYDPKYAGYWALCVSTVSNPVLLSHIRFCNDVLEVPPVKAFLLYHRQALIRITGDPRAVLDAEVKKSIGAFWGMVFKYMLGYSGQKSVSVLMTDFFEIKRATLYF